jgi:hypothetical protein
MIDNANLDGKLWIFWIHRFGTSDDFGHKSLRISLSSVCFGSCEAHSPDLPRSPQSTDMNDMQQQHVATDLATAVPICSLCSNINLSYLSSKFFEYQYVPWSSCRNRLRGGRSWCWSCLGHSAAERRYAKLRGVSMLRDMLRARHGKTSRGDEKRSNDVPNVHIGMLETGLSMSQLIRRCRRASVGRLLACSWRQWDQR